MKKKEKDLLQGMTAKELGSEIRALEQKYELLLLEHDQTKKKNSRQGRLMRNKLAVAKTIQRQKELQS